MQSEKDGRWAKQFGDFAEGLVMYVLGQYKDMSVALVDHVGADLFAVSRKNKDRRYAISVKGRNFPKTESKSYTFTQPNIYKLCETAETFGMEPAVAFVFVDDQEGIRKLRLFIITLQNLRKLCGDPLIHYLHSSPDGIVFKYTESKKTHHLTEILASQYIDYTEMPFTHLKQEIGF